jgi:hypothetical protein
MTGLLTKNLKLLNKCIYDFINKINLSFYPLSICLIKTSVYVTMLFFNEFFNCQT